VRRLSLSVLMTIVMLAVTPPASGDGSAPSPARTARIVFFPWDSTSIDPARLDYEIYTMKPNGTAIRRLTNNDGNDYWPAWSPSGRRIAFSHTDGDSEIFTIRAEGTGLRRVTDNEIEDAYPDWSPRGTKIVFASKVGTDWEIFKINVDGLAPSTIDPRTESPWTPSTFSAHSE
jgi:Tol biopolymer transport system component